MLYIEAFSIFVLIGLSMLFSSGETALTAASQAKIYHHLKKNKRKFQHVKKLTQNKKKIVSVLLIGSNICNILAASLTTAIFIGFFGNGIGVLLATITMTICLTFFAEVVPKMYAVMYPDHTIIGLVYFIRFWCWALCPLSWLVNGVTTVAFRFFGIDKMHPSSSAKDDLRDTIDFHHKEGVFIKNDKDMLDGILDLKELQVEDVMVHRKNIVTFNIQLPPSELIEQILASRHSRIPLWEKDAENILGILYVKDLLLALKEHNFDYKNISIRDILRKPWFIPNYTHVQMQLNAFLKRKNHFSLVVDEYGTLMGLIALEDILEEIVGHIFDEHDEDRGDGVYRQPDGQFLVEGDTSIRDINRLLELDFSDEEATTVAGLVIYECQCIPDIGQVFSFHGFHFEILRKVHNQITLIRMTPDDDNHDHDDNNVIHS